LVLPLRFHICLASRKLHAKSERDPRRRDHNQKRPADTVPKAIRVAKILTGEIEEDTGDSGKDNAAQVLGRRGGAARREKLSAERRSEIARKAAAKRWAGRNRNCIFSIDFADFGLMLGTFAVTRRRCRSRLERKP
jgi:hypothetical protein